MNQTAGLTIWPGPASARPGTMTPRRLRRVAFVVAIAVGVALVAVMLAESELTASSAADQSIAITAPRLTRPALRQLRLDLDEAEAFAAAMRTVGLPRLAALSGERTSTWLGQLGYRDPVLADGVAKLPAIQRLAEKVVTNLERRRDEFESAASLPEFGLTKHEAVEAQLALGGLLILIGAVGVARPRRAAAAVVLAIGAGLVITPLILDYPTKTTDTDALLSSLRPFTVQKVRAREAGLNTVQTVFTAFRGDLIPQAAHAAHTTPRAVVEQLGGASPELSQAGFAQTDAVLRRFGALVAFSARIQPLFARADTLSARATMWILLGAGIALMLAGLPSLFALGATATKREGKTVRHQAVSAGT